MAPQAMRSSRISIQVLWLLNVLCLLTLICNFTQAQQWPGLPDVIDSVTLWPSASPTDLLGDDRLIFTSNSTAYEFDFVRHRVVWSGSLSDLLNHSPQARSISVSKVTASIRNPITNGIHYFLGDAVFTSSDRDVDNSTLLLAKYLENAANHSIPTVILPSNPYDFSISPNWPTHLQQTNSLIEDHEELLEEVCPTEDFHFLVNRSLVPDHLRNQSCFARVSPIYTQLTRTLGLLSDPTSEIIGCVKSKCNLRFKCNSPLVSACIKTGSYWIDSNTWPLGVTKRDYEVMEGPLAHRGWMWPPIDSMFVHPLSRLPSMFRQGFEYKIDFAAPTVSNDTNFFDPGLVVGYPKPINDFGIHSTNSKCTSLIDRVSTIGHILVSLDEFDNESGVHCKWRVFAPILHLAASPFAPYRGLRFSFSRFEFVNDNSSIKIYENNDWPGIYDGKCSASLCIISELLPWPWLNRSGPGDIFNDASNPQPIYPIKSNAAQNATLRYDFNSEHPPIPNFTYSLSSSSWSFTVELQTMNPIEPSSQLGFELDWSVMSTSVPSNTTFLQSHPSVPSINYAPYFPSFLVKDQTLTTLQGVYVLSSHRSAAYSEIGLQPHCLTCMASRKLDLVEEYSLDMSFRFSIIPDTLEAYKSVNLSIHRRVNDSLVALYVMNPTTLARLYAAQYGPSTSDRRRFYLSADHIDNQGIVVRLQANENVIVAVEGSYERTSYCSNINGALILTAWNDTITDGSGPDLPYAANENCAWVSYTVLDDEVNPILSYPALFAVIRLHGSLSSEDFVRFTYFETIHDVTTGLSRLDYRELSSLGMAWFNFTLTTANTYFLLQFQSDASKQSSGFSFEYDVITAPEPDLFRIDNWWAFMNEEDLESWTNQSSSTHLFQTLGVNQEDDFDYVEEKEFCEPVIMSQVIEALLEPLVNWYDELLERTGTNVSGIDAMPFTIFPSEEFLTPNRTITFTSELGKQFVLTPQALDFNGKSLDWSQFSWFRNYVRFVPSLVVEALDHSSLNRLVTFPYSWYTMSSTRDTLAYWKSNLHLKDTKNFESTAEVIAFLTNPAQLQLEFANDALSMGQINVTVPQKSAIYYVFYTFAILSGYAVDDYVHLAQTRGGNVSPFPFILNLPLNEVSAKQSLVQSIILNNSDINSNSMQMLTKSQLTLPPLQFDDATICANSTSDLCGAPQIAGQFRAYLISLRDEYERMVTFGEWDVRSFVIVKSVGRGGINFQVSQQNLTSGIYLITFTPTLAGMYSMTILIEGKDCVASPFSFQVLPDVSNVTSSSISFPDPLWLSSVPQTVIVIVCDQYGNPQLPDREDEVELHASTNYGQNAWISFKKRDELGYYHFEILLGHNDTVEVSLTINNVSGAPVTRKVGELTFTYSEIPLGVRIFIYCLSVVFCIFILVLVIFIYYFREASIIRASAPVFLYLMCGGALVNFLLASFQVTPRSTATCILIPILSHFGYLLMFGSLLVKSYRIVKVYGSRGLRVKVPSPTTLLVFFLSTIILLSLYILLWLIFDPPHLVELKYNLEITSNCEPNSVVSGAILQGIEVLFLFVGVYMCILIRHAPHVFNESRYMGYACCNYLIIQIIMFIFSEGFSENSLSPNVEFLVLACGDFVITVVTIVFIFMPKVYYIIYNLDPRFNFTRVPPSGFAWWRSACKALSTRLCCCSRRNAADRDVTEDEGDYSANAAQSPDSEAVHALPNNPVSSETEIPQELSLSHRPVAHFPGVELVHYELQRQLPKDSQSNTLNRSIASTVNVLVATNDEESGSNSLPLSSSSSHIYASTSISHANNQNNVNSPNLPISSSSSSLLISSPSTPGSNLKGDATLIDASSMIADDSDSEVDSSFPYLDAVIEEKYMEDNTNTNLSSMFVPLRREYGILPEVESDNRNNTYYPPSVNVLLNNTLELFPNDDPQYRYSSISMLRSFSSNDSSSQP